MRIIDLRSDTVTKPSPGMRKAMAEAEVGDDVFEGDPTVKRLEETVARLLGHESALFVPSGTMANQIALRMLTRPGDEVICEVGAHIINYEVAAASALSGIQLSSIDIPGGILTPEAVEPKIRPENIHHPNTSVLALENTHNRAGGNVYPLETISSLRVLAESRGLKYYLDGARVWNAAAYIGVPITEITSGFDAVSVCFSKGLGAPIGSAVVSSKENIKTARRIRKMFGGGMRQVGIIAAGALYALENNLERLIDDHRRAKELALNLAESGLFDLDTERVLTNIVVVNLKSPVSESDFCAALEARGLLLVPFGRGRIRAVAHLDIDDNAIREASEIIIDVARSYS